MGRLIVEYQGTLERFAGDSIMIFFNDPVPVPNPADRAVRMALEMQQEFARLSTAWRKRGYELDMGIGIAQGYATLGAIGFEGRLDYGAIGTVCSLAARLCSQAQGGQTLVSQRVFASLEDRVRAESVGELQLKGFHRPVAAFNIVGWRQESPAG
jgi:adenylate cyclase